MIDNISMVASPWNQTQIFPLLYQYSSTLPSERGNQKQKFQSNQSYQTVWQGDPNEFVWKFEM